MVDLRGRSIHMASGRYMVKRMVESGNYAKGTRMTTSNWGDQKNLSKSGFEVIHQQCGMVHGGTPPLKTEKSNNPPSKNSGGGGRYPPPYWVRKIGTPLARGARRKFFFVFLCSKKNFDNVFFLIKGTTPSLRNPNHGYPPLTKFCPSGSNPPSTEKHLADVWTPLASPLF